MVFGVSLYLNGSYLFVNDNGILNQSMISEDGNFYLERKGEHGFYLYAIIKGKKVYVCNENKFRNPSICLKPLDELKFYQNRLEFLRRDNFLRPMIYGIIYGTSNYLSLEWYKEHNNFGVEIQKMKFLVIDEKNDLVIKIRVKVSEDLESGLM